MPRREFVCQECDMDYVISYRGSEDPGSCPFCGAEVSLDETNEFEDEPE